MAMQHILLGVSVLTSSACQHTSTPTEIYCGNIQSESFNVKNQATLFNVRVKGSYVAPYPHAVLTELKPQMLANLKKQKVVCFSVNGPVNFEDEISPEDGQPGFSVLGKHTRFVASEDEN